jgi:cobalt-zinc-cadmium efflux system membrane fusion protein
VSRQRSATDSTSVAERFFAKPGAEGPRRVDQLTHVRPQFAECLVAKVYVGIGETVKKGDPLLDLISGELAEAKSLYEMAKGQWTRDKKVLDYKTPLARSNTLPGKELIEAENDQAQSLLKMKLAKDRLLIYGLTETEIENIEKEVGAPRARLTLRSPIAGTVIERGAVLGNYYNRNDVLVVIRPALSEKPAAP